MNTKDKGDISEAVIAAEFLKLGIPIAKPFGDNQPYDLIADINGTLKKIQIKTGNLNNGCVRFNTSNSINTNILKERKSENYKGKVDYIAVYCPTNNSCYIINIDKTTNSNMYLRVDISKNNRKTGINWAKDYILSLKSFN